MTISPLSYIKTYVTERQYEEAFDWAEAFFLNPQEKEVVQEAVPVIVELLQKLSLSQQETILRNGINALQNFPNLKEQAAQFLILHGDLFFSKEKSYTHLLTVVKSYSVAYTLAPSLQIENKLSEVFLHLCLISFRKRLERVGGLEDPRSFQELIENIDRFHQKFSTSSKGSVLFYHAAKEEYRDLRESQKKLHLPALEAISLGETREIPLENETPLVVRYRKKLEEARLAFWEEGKVRTLQHKRAKGMREFFQLLFDDAIFLLGEPPCSYEIRVMGSLAREEICPYSDIEYFILIDEERHLPYFKKLAEIFELQILSLGEMDPKRQELFNFGQKFGLEIDHQSNPAQDESLIGTPEKIFALRQDPSFDDLKAYQSRFRSVSLHANHSFELPKPLLDASRLLEMRREEFVTLSILEGEVCEVKKEFVEPLFHFIGDLGLYYGIEERNTLALVDQLPIFSNTSKKLLKEGIADLYNLRIRLHLAHGGIQESVSLIPHLVLPTLGDKEKKALEKIYHLILLPLYEMKLERSDLIEISLRNPTTQNVKAAARFLRQSPLNIQKRYYQMLGSPDHTQLQASFLERLSREAVQRLMWIPNRSGYRQARKFEEKSLAKQLASLTTEDSSSGIKIRSPLLEKELYLKPEVTLFDEQGHIEKVYSDSLHNVNFHGGIHFKELPYQPLMEYAVHSLTHRIMGKATPATSLARIENSAKGVVYPVQISRTIPGKRLEVDQKLDAKHLTWLRLCELLTKPGDGRLSNYVVSKGKVFCIDNDISFMEPVHREKGHRKVSFCSTLFTLNHPLDPEVLQQFCTLEPDLILTDWLEELKEQEKAYLALFSEEELEMFYNLDPERRFSPTLLFPKGTVATLATQFYHLQDVLRNKRVDHPHHLLRELITLQGSEKNQIGLLVERQYQKAKTKPFERRLEAATSARMDQSMTSQKAMQLNYKAIPTFEEKETYSLQEAIQELCLLEAQKLWNEVFVLQSGHEYSIEVDFRKVYDPEREKLLLKTLQFLYEARKQKPTSITMRYSRTLTPKILGSFLHADLRSLDLSYGEGISDKRKGLTSSTFSQLEDLSPNLEELHLEGCPNISTPRIRLANLKRLNLSYIPNLLSLHLDTPELQELKINHCPRITSLTPLSIMAVDIDWKETPGLVDPNLPERLYQLGRQYADGKGVERNPQKALSLWRKASSKGHKQAEKVVEWTEKLAGHQTFKGEVLGVPDVQSLAEAFKCNETVTDVDLSSNLVGDLGAEALAEALKVNTTLVHLNLNHCQVGEVGAQALGEALQSNHMLRKLFLRRNYIQDAGLEAIANILYFHPLTELDLGEMLFGNAGFEALSLALEHSSSLLRLDLRKDGYENHAMGDENLSLLVAGLKKNRTLQILNLTRNQISDKGAVALAKEIEGHPSLVFLHLQNNRIGTPGAQALAQALEQSEKIRHLELDGNQIVSLLPFGEMLKKNRSLQHLSVRANRMEDLGALPVAEALRTNQTLTHLDLSLNGIGDQEATLFAKAMRKNKTLSSLNLSGNQIGDLGAKRIAVSLAVNSALAQLDLSKNRLGQEGCRALVKSLIRNFSLSSLRLDYGFPSLSSDFLSLFPHNPSLKELKINHALIGDWGAESIARLLEEDGTMKKLTLTSCKITERGAAFLAKAVSKHPSLRELNLSENLIGDQGCRHFAEALSQNQTLSKLNLSSNHIQEGACFLAQALEENRSLDILDLSNNEIGDEETENLAGSLAKNHSLQNLVMKKNPIGDRGAKGLAACLELNSSLVELNLNGSEIGEEGAQVLVESLKMNQSLTQLILSDYYPKIELAGILQYRGSLRTVRLCKHQIGVWGARLFGQYLKEEKEWTSLDLRGCMIGDLGAEALAEGLKENRSLLTLELDRNGIGDRGAVALAEALTHNRTLIKLRLWKNKIGDEGAEALGSALARNRTLLDLEIMDNAIGREGAMELFKGIGQNHTLTSLEIWSNRFKEEDYEELIQLLEDNWSLRSLDIDGRNGNLSEKLVNKYLGENQRIRSNALQMIKKGDEEIVGYLDEGFPLFLNVDGNNNTLLHLAATHGHSHLIKLLLERSENPSFVHWRNRDGKTALDLAREGGHEKTALTLSQWNSNG